MRKNRLAGAVTAALVVIGLAVPGSAGAQDHLVTDRCGQLGGTSGEMVTVPQLDVCTADIVQSYDDRSLVLDVYATFAGSVGELTGAAYRFGWTNADGCDQFIEVRDPATSPTAIFAYACGAEQVASVSGVSPDTCASVSEVDNRVCYGEDLAWVRLPSDAVTAVGNLIWVHLPVHLALQDADGAGFSPGDVLSGVNVNTYLRADNANTQVRQMEYHLGGEDYYISPADVAEGGDLTVQSTPGGWDPAPAGAGPAHVLDQGLTLETTNTGRFELVVPEDVTISSSGITVESGGDWAGIMLGDFDDPTAFSAETWMGPGHGGVEQASIEVDSADESAPVTPYGLVLNAAGLRSCSSACPLRAGTYSVLAITEPGAPVKITIKVDGASGPFPTVAGLRSVAVRESSTGNVHREWDPSVGNEAGGTFTVPSVARPDALVFTALESVVDAQLAGRLEVEACVLLGNECTSAGGGHLYAANAAEGREGMAAYGFAELPAGNHGLQLTYSYEEAGGGSFDAMFRVLYVYLD